MSDSSDMHREDNIVLPKSSNTDRDQLVKKRLSPRKESSLKRNVESSDPQMVRWGRKLGGGNGEKQSSFLKKA